jgi:hypothetical protein
MTPTPLEAGPLPDISILITVIFVIIVIFLLIKYGDVK